MIRNILVPIDLSDYSVVTLRYAAGLAQFLGSEGLHVIHVFTPQATADALSVPPVAKMMKDREDMLNQWVEENSKDIKVNITKELCLGFAADEIVSQSKSHELLVMGCQGETDLLEEVFGSVSSSVAQRSHCPTILVPKRAEFSEYRNIVYASNSLSLSRRAVLKLMDFNELFHARVHFVNVSEGEELSPREREKLFAPLFANPHPEFSFETAEVKAESVHAGLKDYLEKNAVDLSIMVTKKRGFWQRLFHRSETKQFALHPVTPLMVLHLEEN